MNLQAGCPKVEPKEVAAAVDDPRTGIGDALKGITLANVLQTVDQIVPKVRAAAPNVAQADVVNGLSAAYCPVITADTSATGPQKAIEFNNFSVRVYSALRSNGKD